ncbi:MAG: DUF3365 domain-containing protein [Bacteroidetes bacterium]|nr:DUF3365 domain-containing protein [Bacteroidota bacterium]
MTCASVPRTRLGWKRGIWTVALSLLVLAACGGSNDAAEANKIRTDAEATARRATEKLTGTLMGEVQKSIKERGLAGTVTHCSNRAQELSTLVGAEEGVVIRRVTEKTRNPVDAPDVFERRVLAHFAQLAQRGEIDASTAYVEVVREDDREMLRFLKPITIKKPCLGCHGPSTSLADDVRQAIHEQYPSDLATGYSEGDLRGAVSVSVPLGED